MSAKKGYSSKKGEGLRFEIKEDELRKLYLKQKLSTTQIGKMYNLSADTIRIRLKEFGIKSTGQGRGIRSKDNPGRGAAWTKEEKEKVIRFYKAHPDCGDINEFARKLGRSRRAISIQASKLGLTKEWNIIKNGGRSDSQKESLKKHIQKIRDTGKLSSMSEEKARKLFEKFKKSNAGITMFSKMKGYHAEGLAKVFKKYFPDEYEFLLEEKRMKKDSWYKKGRRFEYAVRNYFLKKGYWVLRSPRSGGPIDLIAIKNKSILMIQCKSGASTLLLKEKMALIEACELTGGCPILAYRTSPKKTAFKKCLKEGYLDVFI
jgi:Holliday junction resolvase